MATMLDNRLAIVESDYFNGCVSYADEWRDYLERDIEEMLAEINDYKMHLTDSKTW